jgi:hypothetical protein
MTKKERAIIIDFADDLWDKVEQYEQYLKELLGKEETKKELLEAIEWLANNYKTRWVAVNDLKHELKVYRK